MFFRWGSGSCKVENPCRPLQGPPRSWEPGYLEWEAQQKRSSAASALASSGLEKPYLEPSRPLAERHVLSCILSLLPPNDLARCQAVSLAWQEIAQQSMVQEASFLQHWGLAGLKGFGPHNWKLAQRATLPSFVRRVPISRADSLPALAIKYSVNVISLKQLNNITSDHSLYSRHYLFIPLTCPEDLHGGVAAFFQCPMARRVFLVVSDKDGADLTSITLHPKDLQRTQEQKDQLALKMAALMSRSMNIDEQSALWYIQEAEGNLKSAMQMCERDSAWEASSSSSLRQQAVSVARSR